MKLIFYTFILSIVLCSCEKKIDAEKKIEISKEKKNQWSESFGNEETEKRFNYFHGIQIVREDSLRKLNFLNQKISKLNSNSKPIVENDFDNGKGAFFREFSIKISDTIEIKALQKSDHITEYIYTYNDKPFNIVNYYGEMFWKNSDISFDFDTRECYRVTTNKYLMREQPTRWCGLANQFDIFQIVDLDKMEMIQFADYDNKLRESSGNRR